MSGIPKHLKELIRNGLESLDYVVCRVVMNKDNLCRCVRCGLPETYETIEFDSSGVCNICRGSEHKQQTIDWDERKLLLDQLIEKYRGKSDYDCIVPFSGGEEFSIYHQAR